MNSKFPFAPSSSDSHLVVDLEEEQKIQKEAEALVELHDFIKSHPDAPVKEIAKFMPPVDSRAVNKAIQMIALREEDGRLTS
jgi:ABC-type nitrate/sulfonate/bicarbonate transport system substrate-binding protein